jgi:hypothetical protein
MCGISTHLAGEPREGNKRSHMSIETMSFILGGLLVAVGLLGGGIEVRELKVPSVGRASRLLSFVAGVAFIGLALFLNPGATGEPQTAGKPPSEEVHATAEPQWMTSAQYQMAFNNKVREGFYPSKVEGRCHDGVEEFRVEWKGTPLGTSFASHHGVTKGFYDNKNREYTASGYSLETLNTFKDCSGVERYQATWFRRR